MKSENTIPKISVKLKSYDWIIECISLLLCGSLLALPVIYVKDLPEIIPIHFNGAGMPDGYGSRSTIFLLPVIGAAVYLLMTILAVFPKSYNYPVKITPENAAIQFSLASRFIRILKALILILFIYICYQTINTAMGLANGLGMAFLPVFLLTITGSIIIYFVLARNNSMKS
jgi:uncharacterized membrane protein